MKKTIIEEFDDKGLLLKRTTIEEYEPQINKAIPYTPYIPPYNPLQPGTPSNPRYDYQPTVISLTDIINNAKFEPIKIYW